MDLELAVETRGLTRRFGDFVAVDALDLQVPRGTFYGFLGPNGAGKSTTIKMLTGLLARSGGEIRILGLDVADPEAALAAKRRVGVVPEGLALFENLTAREQLTLVGRLHRLDEKVLTQRREELLELMGLSDADRKLTLEFSHGMKKKLALAAALIPDPELLFLDEPFEGVDAVSARVLRDTLHRCIARGATIFLTSHVLEIVERLCTRIGIIADGRMVCDEPIESIRANGSLEDRFLAAVGGTGAPVQPLSWLDAHE